MKFASYNILHGGQGKDINRLPLIKKAISVLNPDFIGIEEANAFDKSNNTIFNQFKRELGFTYADISIGWGDKEWLGSYNIANFSKIPTETVNTYNKKFRNGLMHSVVRSNLGDISVITGHLHHKTEDHRLKEIDFILKEQSTFDHFILMGDLNSLSIRDGYRKDIISSFNDKQITKFTSNKRLRFDVLEKLYDAGYIDSFVEKKKNQIKTVPTTSNIDAAHETPLRLDYILVSRSLKEYIKSVSVVRDEITNQASDHYPLVCELDDIIFRP